MNGQFLGLPQTLVIMKNIAFNCRPSAVSMGHSNHLDLSGNSPITFMMPTPFFLKNFTCRRSRGPFKAFWPSGPDSTPRELFGAESNQPQHRKTSPLSSVYVGGIGPGHNDPG